MHQQQPQERGEHQKVEQRGTVAVDCCLSRHKTPPPPPLASPEAPQHLARAATMDEHKEKEDKFQESSEQQQPRKQEAEEQEHNSEESMDQHQEAYKEGRNSEEAKEATVVQLKEVEASSEEEASSPSSVLGIFAHPCSLLQYLLRACADWCWGLHGTFDDDPKPQAAAVVAPTEAVAPANSTEQGDGGGEKANYFYMQEVVTRVWAVRRGRPPGRPGHPREGSGGNGGIHH